jgi:adenylyltransferase/sulfurtransferase
MTIEITPQALHQLLQDDQAAARLQLVDVRRQEEVAIGTLPNAHHLVLQELPQRWQELDPTLPTVTLCHHGVRSLQAAQFLLQQGFAQVQSLKGGIDRWSQEIDPTLPRY